MKQMSNHYVSEMIIAWKMKDNFKFSDLPKAYCNSNHSLSTGMSASHVSSTQLFFFKLITNSISLMAIDDQPLNVRVA